MDDSQISPESVSEELIDKPARRCLIVEPDTALQENYSAALISGGFEVIASHSVGDVLADSELRESVVPSVLLIAVDGYVEYHEPRLIELQQQLRSLRKQWPESSLIVLADGTPADWLHALAVDDLLPKVSSLATITARCIAANERFLLRQHSGDSNPWQSLAGGVDVVESAGLLRLSRHRLRVTLSEYMVFSELLAAKGERCSYSALSQALGYPADPLSVMALIKAAEKRFSQTLPSAFDLQQLPHFGYRLVPKIVAADSEASGEEVDSYGLIDAELAQPEKVNNV